jgi:hypothetical protein
VPARVTGTAKLGGGSTRSKAGAARSSISVARSAQARGKTISCGIQRIQNATLQHAETTRHGCSPCWFWQPPGHLEHLSQQRHNVLHGLVQGRRELVVVHEPHHLASEA